MIRFFLPAQCFFSQNYPIFRGRTEKLGEKIGKIIKKKKKIPLYYNIFWGCCQAPIFLPGVPNGIFPGSFENFQIK